MSRFVLLVMALLVSLSITTAAVAHAFEPVTCMDTSTAEKLGHSSGDRDEVPADSEKGYPHHHGGCHGHQIADRVSDTHAQTLMSSQIIAPIALLSVVPTAPKEPALRPPIA